MSAHFLTADRCGMGILTMFCEFFDSWPQQDLYFNYFGGFLVQLASLGHLGLCQQTRILRNLLLLVGLYWLS